MKKVLAFLLMVSNLFAYRIADSFEYPVFDSNNWVVAQDFQDCRIKAVPSGITPCRHLGEDLNYFDNNSERYLNAGQSIKSIANGYIVASGVKNGFAGYIIMKHYLDPDDDKKYILSIYGHLSTKKLPKKNTFFKKGVFLSTIATDQEMKKWTTFEPHLHFEIRKSKSITGYNDTYLNDGYMKDNLHYYYDPTDIKTLDWNTGEWLKKDENIMEGFIESHKSVNIENKSIIDGAGSLIRPEILNTTDRYSCQWGCYRDEAHMQKHSSPSTISFQWKATKNCKKLKIGIKASSEYRKKYKTWINPHDPLKVKIYRKAWDNDIVTEAFKTTLPKTVDYVTGWNNIIITSQEPLSKVQKIIAECTESDDGKDITILSNETSIELPLDYKFGGQSSIIRGSNKEYNEQKDGIYQDVAIGLSNNKSMTLFQWQTSTNCKSLVLKSGHYPNEKGISASVNGINIKSWNNSTWSNTLCNNKLPCTINAPTTNGGEYGNYYIIKVKTNASTLDGNRISAVCKQ